MRKTNQKGITLIALIVTIIVLIIIAGISIATLTNDNGVLRQTNLAKVTQIEATGREIVQMSTATMRLAIAEAQATNNKYSAADNADKIQKKLLEVIKADTAGTDLKVDGWPEESELDAVGEIENGIVTFTITYKGEDYKQACNDTEAQIIYTFKVGQKTIEVTGVGSGLKDENDNDVGIDIGGDTQTPSTPSEPDEPTVPETTKYSVTANLTNATIDNTEVEVEEGSSYNATITAEEGYEISSVTVTMGEIDITDTAYTSDTGAISISSVTGNIVITATTREEVTGYDAVEKVAIGDYVYFNVPYDDVYSGTGYNEYTGWRVIDDGQTHARDETEGTGVIKLISTGTPLKYQYTSTVVTGLNDLTTGFFSTTWASNGFTKQNLTTAFSEESDIIAKYEIGDTYIDDYTGAAAYTTTPVATANQLKVRAVNLSDLNRARGGATLKSTTSFSSNGTLYYNPSGATWLASAFSASSNGLRNVRLSGGVSSGNDDNARGVRPVVSLKSGVQVTSETKLTEGDITYWVMQ